MRAALVPPIGDFAVAAQLSGAVYASDAAGAPAAFTMATEVACWLGPSLFQLLAGTAPAIPVTFAPPFVTSGAVVPLCPPTKLTLITSARTAMTEAPRPMQTAATTRPNGPDTSPFYLIKPKSE